MEFRRVLFRSTGGVAWAIANIGGKTLHIGIAQPAKSGKTGNKHPGLDEIGARVFILVAADAASIDLDPGLRRRECKHGPGILPGRARNPFRNIPPAPGIPTKARRQPETKHRTAS